MIKKILINLFLGAAIGLNLYLFTPIQTKVESDIEPFLKEFISITETYCTKDQYNAYKKYVISVEKLEYNWAGVCYIFPFKFIILFDTTAWKEYDHKDKLQLTFHEFTHCFLNKDHIDDKTHYMYKAMTDDLTEDDIKNQLIEILKEKCNKKEN